MSRSCVSSHSLRNVEYGPVLSFISDIIDDNTPSDVLYSPEIELNF